MNIFQGRVVGRRTQALIIMALIIMALMLLSLLPGLSAVGASNIRDNAQEAGLLGREQIEGTATLTYTFYMPYLRRDPTPTPTATPPATFVDDFSNPNSGWIIGEDDDCIFEYTSNGYYRITVKTKGHRCIAFNPKIPEVKRGTFKVDARRTSGDSRFINYGFLFSTPGGGMDADYHWSLEVFPIRQQCKTNKRGFYWLSYRNGFDSDDEPKGELVDDPCSLFVNTGRYEWNSMKVRRTDEHIDVYINDKKEDETRDEGADRILTDEGYFDLIVTGIDFDDDDEGVVEFDSLVIERE